MKLTLTKVLGRKYQQVVFVFNFLPAMSADNLCKQFGPRSGPTKCWAWSGSKLFDSRMVMKNPAFKELNMAQ